MAENVVKPKIVWDFCPLCDPFGDYSEAYLAHSRPTVRIVGGIGYCQSCGWRDDVREAPAGAFDVAGPGEERPE